MPVSERCGPGGQTPDAAAGSPDPRIRKDDRRAVPALPSPCGRFSLAPVLDAARLAALNEQVRGALFAEDARHEDALDRITVGDRAAFLTEFNLHMDRVNVILYAWCLRGGEVDA